MRRNASGKAEAFCRMMKSIANMYSAENSGTKNALTAAMRLRPSKITSASSSASSAALNRGFAPTPARTSAMALDCTRLPTPNAARMQQSEKKIAMPCRPASSRQYIVPPTKPSPSRRRRATAM